MNKNNGNVIYVSDFFIFTDLNNEAIISQNVWIS